MKSCHQYGPWVKVLRPSSSYYYWKRNWLHQRKFLKSWKKFIIWCRCYLKMWLTESSWLAVLAAAVIQSFSEENFLLHLYSATWAKIFSRSHLTLTKIQSPTAVLLRNILTRTIRPHSQLLLLLPNRFLNESSYKLCLTLLIHRYPMDQRLQPYQRNRNILCSFEQYHLTLRVIRLVWPF